MLNISHTKILILVSVFFFNCNKIEKEKPIFPLLSAPQRPIDLVATEVGESYIKLSWIDNSTNETGFKIEKRTEQSMYSTLASTEKDISSFIDSNLTWNVKYTYRVFSYNSVGFSSTHSNEVSVTTLAPISPVLSNVEGSGITFFQRI